MRRLFPVTHQTAKAPGHPATTRGEDGGGGGGGGGAGTGARDGAGAGAGGEWSLAELADAYAYPDFLTGANTEPREPGVPREPGQSDGSDRSRESGRSGESDRSGEQVWSGRSGEMGRSGEPGRSGAPARTWLRANMVSTLDGAAQHQGRSQPISCAADMRIFGTLRALADAVLVGAETVRKEGYRPARARAEFAARREAAGQGPAPAIAIVTAGLDLDFSLPLFTSPLVPTLLLTGASAPQDRIAAAERAGARVVVAGEGTGVDPARAVRALAEHGHTRLLTEGGPRLLGQLVAAGVLDEFCLTLSPMLTAGDAQRIAGGPAVEVPQRFSLVSLLEEDGFLFARYRR